VSRPLHVGLYQGSPAHWDEFVRAQPSWSHFHLYGWRGIMERVLGHDSLYFAATNDAGTLQGVLPLVRVKSVVFGHYLVSMPFLNYGGPLGGDEAVRALTNAAVDQAKRDGVKMLELRSRIELPLSLDVSHRKITVVLDIPSGGTDALWKGFDAKVRSQVRRPQKEGVTVRFGPDQVAPFFAIFAEHMRDLGTPTQPRKLFEDIARTFPDDSLFGCAYLDGVPVAGGCGFRWGTEFEITWASALRAYNKISPNMLLYWEFIQRSARDGATLFNFGRCTPGGGTHKFKRQWGARDEMLWWYEQRADGATTPAEAQGAFGWGPRIWQKLPLSVATAIGPHVVRFIP
jgi:serine/alanine adding enzyme